MIDVGSETTLIGSDSYHAGCPPILEKMARQGQPGLPRERPHWAKEQGRASRASTAGEARLSSVDRHRAGADHPSRNTAPTSSRAFRCWRGEVALVFKNWGITVERKSVYVDLYRMDLTPLQVDDACRVASKHGALHIGYVWKICSRWAGNDDLWRKQRLNRVGPGRPWRPEDDEDLRELVLTKRLEIPELAIIFDRTEIAIQNRITSLMGERLPLYPAWPKPVPPKGTKHRRYSRPRAGDASSVSTENVRSGA